MSEEPYKQCKTGVHCNCFKRTGTCCWCCATDEAILKREYLRHVETTIRAALKKYPEEVKEIIRTAML